MLKQSPSFNTTQSKGDLNRWLAGKGIKENPFERWNAENDQDLQHYFVDIGDFDDLLILTKPCLVFAKRGCGKTAQRQMLAAQCRPLRPDSTRLAVNYTYNGFEQVLGYVNDDLNQIRSIHHVRAILQLGVTALVDEMARDPAVQLALVNPTVRPNLDAYVARFAPQPLTAPTTETSSPLDKLESLALLQGFVKLVRAAGLETCVILVDGLDEFPLTAGDPAQIATFLSYLLGTLPLIECPGLAFKFSLPQELEPVLRDYKDNWFRLDRLYSSPLVWEKQGLVGLVNQRLAYFSREREPPYESLAQLCEDGLRQVINDELATLAQGLPRAALILARMLLQYHCQQVKPPDLIRLQTWEQVKANWSVQRQDFVTEQQPTVAASKEVKTVSASASVVPDYPVLRVEEEKRLVWLGERDITSEIRPQDYRVLVCLYQHLDRVCKIDFLIEKAWPEDKQFHGVTDQTVTASLSRLRRTFRQFSPDDVEYIKTFKAQGYRLYANGLEKSKNKSG